MATGEMMMSQRPSGGDNGGPIGSAAVSIGNYKGVMLCNRPFAGASGAAAKQDAVHGGSFKCGTVETQWGANVSTSEHQKLVAKSLSKKNSVLSKHRKWLNDLQKMKDSLQDEYVSELEEKEKKKEKFMAREAKMRAVVSWLLVLPSPTLTHSLTHLLTPLRPPPPTPTPNPGTRNPRPHPKKRRRKRTL